MVQEQSVALLLDVNFSVIDHDVALFVFLFLFCELDSVMDCNGCI